MKFLVCGAGTIGTTYAYLLSQVHDVDLYVKPEQAKKFSKGTVIALKDLRKNTTIYKKHHFRPHCVTHIDRQYDGIIVAVNRYQLKDLLPLLAEKQTFTKYFAFMQNNWNMRSEVEEYLDSDHYVIAFPSSVGGGRDENGIEAILFDEPTRLGGECQFAIRHLQEGFRQAGIRTHYDRAIFDWLKVHYLQQSITAGAVLENGSFEKFAHNNAAVRKMVRAFREGIAICKLQGVHTAKTFPANMFRLPVVLVAHIMQKMFLEQNTVEMVNNHMKQGMPEWVVGFKEVLNDGRKSGLSMKVWQSYDEAVEKYLKSQQIVR